ncbi:MAG: hypothetical protein ACPGO3_06425 [Magnetospiraceae bacterium]
MARLSFTANLHRHGTFPGGPVAGATVAEVLANAFTGNARSKDYILDEHGALRKHMVIFVDGALIQDRIRLSDPVSPTSHIHVFQALSGG